MKQKHRPELPDALAWSRAKQPNLGLLAGEIRSAANSSTECTIVGFTHILLTSFLRRQWLVERMVEAAKVVFLYGDNSKGGEIPLKHLGSPRRDERAEGESIRLGTLSARHLDYDQEIDLYLIRHAETTSLTSGSIEKLAHERMSKFLNQAETALLREIRIFQSGLEPLAIGMYKALHEYLAHCANTGKSPLLITTVFYLDPTREPLEWV